MACEYPRVVSPIPAELPIPQPPKARSGQLREGYWKWCDGEGRLLKITQRFPDPERGKVVLPYTLWQVGTDKFEWRQKDLLEPRPLYGLDRLAQFPDAVVVLVEGEKAADAVSQVIPGSIGLTSGSATSAGKAAWEPLRGRDVFIWQDHDEPGRRYAWEVTAKLIGVARSTRLVHVPANFPMAWDLADPLPAGVSPTDIQSLLENAPLATTSEMDVLNPNTVTLHKTTEPTRALRIMSAGEVFERPPRPREWLWGPFIPLGREGMVAAMSDVGKTAFHLQLAVAVATGRALFGFPTRPTPSGVLFLTYEDDPAEDFRERLAWVKETYENWGPADQAALHKNLFLADPTWDRDCSLRNIHDEIESVLDSMKAQVCPPALVIIETLASVTKGDGNSDESTREVWNIARALRKRHGVTVSLAHHHRKPSNEEVKDALGQLDPRKARGTSNNEGSARWIIQLAAIPHEKAEAVGLDPAHALKGAYALLGATKVKADRPDPLVLERLPGGVAGSHCWVRRLDGDRIFAKLLASKRTKAELDKQERVGLAILELRDRASKEEVQRLAGIEPRAVETAVTSLRKKALMGPSRSPYILTPDGMAWAQALKSNSGDTQMDAFDEMLAPMRVSVGSIQVERRSTAGVCEERAEHARAHTPSEGCACVSCLTEGKDLTEHRLVL